MNFEVMSTVVTGRVEEFWECVIGDLGNLLGQIFAVICYMNYTSYTVVL